MSYALGIGSRLLDLCQGLREACINGRKRCGRTSTVEEVEGWHVGKANTRGRRRGETVTYHTSLQIIGKIAKQAHVTFTKQSERNGH